MAFNPTLADAISRIRFALGDTGATSLLVPGGETSYTALLAINAGDEGATMRTAAAALATYYAAKPNRISDLGSSIAWDERVDQWNKIAKGEIDPLPPNPDSPAPADGPRIALIAAGRDWRPR